MDFGERNNPGNVLVDKGVDEPRKIRGRRGKK